MSTTSSQKHEQIAQQWGTINKIGSYCSYTMETQKVIKKNKINHMKSTLRPTLRTEKTKSGK